MILGADLKGFVGVAVVWVMYAIYYYGFRRRK